MRYSLCTGEGWNRLDNRRQLGRNIKSWSIERKAKGRVDMLDNSNIPQDGRVWH
jgi:hypothetical protein